ncbi:ArsC family reductase [Chromatiaceae bacterium AAb-1]|nr:ArsC family reductase [Chromatiaceae bacterium AAb-1]
MIKVYGIKNCDTIKKARKWLEQHNLAYQFIDYRVDGLTSQQLQEFATTCTWQSLLNTRGTTFRNLPSADQAELTADKALALMLEHPAMIKRPLLEKDGQYHLGFSEKQYQAIFGINI